jgi:O-methyltransferase involved in polyketide biosynthesis
MVAMAGKQSADLGDVQQTLFIPLAARAAQTRRKHPALRDPKAVEILDAVDADALYTTHPGGFVTVVRTLMFDWWVRQFLAEHPGGTVVELGTGLNTRFERVDNGRCHWIDLDLPDTIEMRRRFFADTDRRQMIAASVLDDTWHEAVAACPPPYFFVSDGVLVYLEEDHVKAALTRIGARFGGSILAFDTYGKRGPAWHGSALGMVVRRPALPGACRAAGARLPVRHPAASWPAPGAASPVPVAASAGRPGAPHGLHAHPVPRRLSLPITRGRPSAGPPPPGRPR